MINLGVLQSFCNTPFCLFIRGTGIGVCCGRIAGAVRTHSGIGIHGGVGNVGSRHGHVRHGGNGHRRCIPGSLGRFLLLSAASAQAECQDDDQRDHRYFFHWNLLLQIMIAELVLPKLWDLDRKS